MVKRIFYTIKMGWRHRFALKRYSRDPKLRTNTLLELNPETLKNQGIQVIVIDFDGVLANYGEDFPVPLLTPWMQSCINVFGKDKIYILSNKPTEKRKAYFSNLGIEFIYSRKKPYPDGLLKILEKTKLDPQGLMLIDDRLLTGILAAEIVGAQAKWVTEPYINLRKRPLPELCFILLRALERWWL